MIDGAPPPVSERDQFPPSRVVGVIRAHDSAMDDVRGEMLLHKSTFKTDFWRHGRQSTKGGSWNYGRSVGVDIEVNELLPMVRAKIAAIFRATQRVSCNPDPMGRGDPDKAALVYNAWLTQAVQKPRILRALTQLELYPGIGFKVATVSGTAPAIERVQLRVVPWWEVVLDRDVTDEEEERFRGHVYWMPRKEAEAKWPDVEGKLTGTVREDFLASSTAQASRAATSRRNTRGSAPKGVVGAVSQDDDWVRVLEFYNLRDPITKDGSTYTGRLEIWILEQAELSQRPILMDTLPFATPSGKPMANIIPCILLPEPEYPFRGIPPAKKVMPQLAEQNLCRSHIAKSARLNARKGLVRPNVLGTAAKDVLVNGEDMEYAEVNAEMQGSLAEAIYNIPHSPIAADLYKWQELLAADKSAVRATPPSAMGQPAGRDTTAYEIQTMALAAENETGMSAGVFLAAMTEVLTLVGRGVILNMTQRKDSASGNAGPAVALAPEGAVRSGDDTPEQMATDAKNTVKAEVSGGVDPLRAIGGLFAPGETESGDEFVQDILQVQDDKGAPVAITVADLDGDFGVTFVEGVRTPMTDAAKQQALMQVYPQYEALWDQVLAGGPKALLAEAMMRTIATRFDLPEEMHVDAMRAAMQREAAPQAAPPTAMQRAARPTGGAPPPQAATDAAPAPESGAEPAPAQADMNEALDDAEQALAGGNVDEAVRILQTAFGDNPAIRDVIDRAASVDDPTEKGALINDIIGRARMALAKAEQGAS